MTLMMTMVMKNNNEWSNNDSVGWWIYQSVIHKFLGQSSILLVFTSFVTRYLTISLATFMFLLPSSQLILFVSLPFILFNCSHNSGKLSFTNCYSYHQFSNVYDFVRFLFFFSCLDFNLTYFLFSSVKTGSIKQYRFIYGCNN